MTELHLRKRDFRVDWFSGSGAGGQHRNKHQNCCRITHIASGANATGQSHRERPANQKEAFNKLAAMLVLRYCAKPAPERAGVNVRIRSYHAERNEVIGHASGQTQSYVRTVDSCDLGPLIEARRAAMTGQDDAPRRQD